MVIGVDRAAVHFVPEYACRAGVPHGVLLRRRAEDAGVTGGIVGVQPRPGDVARATQADTAGLVAVPQRTVVAGGRVRAGVTGHQARAVQEVAVLVDSQTQVSADQPVVRLVGVRAGVTQASTPGAEAISVPLGGAVDRARIQLTGIHQVEADAVRTVAARPAGVPEIGDGLEGDRDALTGREGRRRHDAAVLVITAGEAVGEAQRTLADRVGKGAVEAAHQGFTVVTGLDGRATGHLASGAAGGYYSGSGSGGQTRAVKEVPDASGARAGEVLTECRLRLAGQRRGEGHEPGQHGNKAVAVDHKPPLLTTPCATS